VAYIVLGADIGPFRTPIGTWTPAGPLWTLSPRKNPPLEWPRTFAGRLFIGFNVAGKKTWKLQDIADFVGEHWIGSASIIAQKGIWRESVSAEPEPEDSAQVVILSDGDEWGSLTEFKQAVLALGDLAREMFEQDAVLYQIQDQGISKGAGRLVAYAPPRRRRRKARR
jgi:hypothetical protein